MSLIQKFLSKSMVACPKCGAEHTEYTLAKKYYVCPSCGKLLKYPVRQRMKAVFDSGSVQELHQGLTSRDFLNFPDYAKKLDSANRNTGEEENVISGIGSISGKKCAFFLMNPDFIMGSLGSVAGEKITRTFEYATAHNLPVIGFTASGGARMQEGIISLMQMAKVTAAVQQHGSRGNLYIAVLTNPTTGGVTASFAMEGDITLAEPEALIGFAGRRVVEQTTGTNLPQNFQKSEFLQEHGFVDHIVPREELRTVLKNLLEVHPQNISA